MFVGLAVGVAVVGVFVLGRVAHRGPFAPTPWTNVKTGQIAGPGYVGITVPYESSKGCASGGYTSSISWLRGSYLQNWTGSQESVTGTFEAETTLPPGAVFTGWERGNDRLWVNPADESSPGTYRYLYVVRPDRVERWPRATFGCS